MKHVTAFLLCCLITIAYAQEKERQIIPPSPNAAALAKYGNIPISYYTGTVNISVPIYTIQIRDISVPISLDYHTGGIKVSEEASRVGLGWVLSCGGLISRNIVNDDDLAAHPWAYLSAQNNSPQLPSGPRFQKASVLGVGGLLNFYDSETSATSTIDLTDYIYGAEFDYEPDHFTYNFAGHSGKFVMGRDRTAIIERQEKISLVPSLDGNSWEVKTADGFKYFFGAFEYSVDFNDTGARQISAWYLTKILSPLGEEVNFEYKTLDDQFIRPVGSYQEKVVPVSTSCGTFICKAVHGKVGPLPRKMYSNVALSRVTWKLGKVEFVFGNRDDIDGDIRVDAINVFGGLSDDFRLLASYKLDYDYFNYQVAGPVFIIPDVGEEKLTKRLKLKAVRKFAGEAGLPAEWAYSFKYHENSHHEQLPPKNSYARDHWGYYNGRQNTSLIPDHQSFSVSATPTDMIGVIGDNRDPSDLHMKAFSLKEVTYPTGGTTTLFYEANDFDFKDQAPNTSAFPVYQQVLYDCQANAGHLQSTPLDLTNQYISSAGIAIPVEISAAFRANQECDQLTNVTDVYFEVVDLEGTLISRVSLGLPACINPDQRDCIYCDSDNPGSGIFTYKGMMTIPRGRYYLRAFSPQGEDRFEDISVSIKAWMDSRQQSPVVEGSRIALAGGLRIARIDDHDPVTGQTSTRTFTYNFFDDRNGDGHPELHSYGKRMAVPRYSYFDIFWEKWDGSPYGGQTCIQCVNLIRQSDSFVPATGSQGYSVGYDKVIETRGLSGDNGWTEYEFHNESDIPIEIMFPNVSGEYPMRAPSTSTIPSPLNGLQKSKAQYRFDNIPVSKVVTHYNLKFNKTIYGVEYRRIQAVNFFVIDFFTAYRNLGLHSDLITITYPSIQSSLIEAGSTTEIHFDSTGNQTLVNTTQSFHDNLTHLQTTRSTTTTSEGKVLTTSVKYAADYNDAQADEAISRMKSGDHIHATPVEVTVTDETDPNNLKILSKSLTVFDINNDHVLPKENVVLDNAAPVNASAVPNYKPSAGYDSLKYRRETLSTYSSTRNLQRIKRRQDIDISYLWGYDGSLPVAEVANATNTLFEFTQPTNSSANIGVTIGGTAPHTFTFHVDYRGSVYLKLGVPGTPSYATVATYSGIESGSITLSTGACGTTVIPFINVAPGAYQITVLLSAAAENVGACGEIIYPKIVEVPASTGITEFFYEGFENKRGVPIGPSHTGNRSWPGDYTVDFSPPSQRPYKVEYWYLAGDEWNYHTERYFGPTMALTNGAAIDDVRIYPVDARMKSYTYDPGVGITSAILDSGKTIIYEYDPYGRLAVIRGGERNIERAFEYSYLNR